MRPHRARDGALEAERDAKLRPARCPNRAGLRLSRRSRPPLSTSGTVNRRRRRPPAGRRGAPTRASSPLPRCVVSTPAVVAAGERTEASARRTSTRRGPDRGWRRTAMVFSRQTARCPVTRRAGHAGPRPSRPQAPGPYDERPATVPSCRHRRRSTPSWERWRSPDPPAHLDVIARSPGPPRPAWPWACLQLGSASRLPPACQSAPLAMDFACPRPARHLGGGAGRASGVGEELPAALSRPAWAGSASLVFGWIHIGLAAAWPWTVSPWPWAARRALRLSDDPWPRSSPMPVNAVNLRVVTANCRPDVRRRWRSGEVTARKNPWRADRSEIDGGERVDHFERT